MVGSTLALVQDVPGGPAVDPRKPDPVPTGPPITVQATGTYIPELGQSSTTGKQEVVSVTIDPSAVDPADVEMLQDLVVAAVNDAIRASRQLEAEKMAAVTGGLKIPGL